MAKGRYEGLNGASTGEEIIGVRTDPITGDVLDDGVKVGGNAFIPVEASLQDDPTDLSGGYQATNDVIPKQST